MYKLSQFWNTVQSFLFPHLEEILDDPLSEKQKKLVAILELVRIEDCVPPTPFGIVGRPRKSRKALARAFVAKAVYNLTTTSELIDRLKDSPNLRRLCGWETKGKIPSESVFSRAFAEFAETELPQKVHENLIKKYRKDHIVGHISRDSTAISAREKPVPKPKQKDDEKTKAKPKRKRGRPKKGEEPPPKEPTRLQRQKTMSLQEMLEDLPKECDRGCKKNSKGYKETWTGYKLHLDCADGQIPISCILTSASLHDSQAAIPLAAMTAERVTSLYSLMDSAYDAKEIKDYEGSLQHVPIIDNNPRRGEKLEMDPATKRRYNERTTVERDNGRVKDEFGGRTVRVRGHAKVWAHLTFGVLVLAADQLLRLVL